MITDPLELEMLWATIDALKAEQRYAYERLDHRRLHPAKENYRVMNAEQIAAKNRDRWLKYNYNLTQDDYVVMLEAQGGVCKICGKTSQIGRRLAVDHCHTTGLVRGLLCENCNVGIGKLKEDISILESAIKYLKESRGEPIR